MKYGFLFDVCLSLATSVRVDRVEKQGGDVVAKAYLENGHAVLSDPKPVSDEAMISLATKLVKESREEATRVAEEASQLRQRSEILFKKALEAERALLELSYK